MKIKQIAVCRHQTDRQTARHRQKIMMITLNTPVSDPATIAIDAILVPVDWLAVTGNFIQNAQPEAEAKKELTPRQRKLVQLLTQITNRP